MSTSQRIPALLAYLLLIVGWLYVLLFQRGNRLAVFHTKQSIGLVLFTAGITVMWAASTWVLASIPYAFTLSAALFSLVIAAYFFAVVVWVLGMVSALRASAVPLPLFGRWADRLPLGRG